MKIIDERKSKLFAEVAAGQVFYATDENNGSNYAYMKTFKIKDTGGDLYNAVDLQDGDLVYFDGNDHIILCDATLTIH